MLDATFLIPETVHMWVVIALTVLAMASFAWEKYPLEVTGIGLIAILLVFFQFFPLLDSNGLNRLDARTLLAGFANPSLVAVLALLVMGQAMVQTDALSPLVGPLTKMALHSPALGVGLALVAVMVISPFMNNTPLVIIAIPILQSMALRLGLSPSRIMMPLSYAAILGGMTTLIGSSTNLLVSSALTDLGLEPLGFFDFTIPGVILAAVGALYTLVLLPRFMPDREGLASEITSEGKQFIGEIDVGPDSALVGEKAVAGAFPVLPDMTVRLIQRGSHTFLPPFESYEVQPGDVMIVAATRKVLMDALTRNKGYLLATDPHTSATDQDTSEELEKKVEKAKAKNPGNQVEASERLLGEIMIAPASRIIDQSIDQIGFRRRFGVLLLGIQRRARMVRGRLGDIRVEAGDVLLVAGTRRDIEGLRNNAAVILLSGSKREFTAPQKAPLAVGIFFGAVALAAFGILPITVAAVLGAVLMVVTGCLNIRQAARSIDRKILILVASSLALGAALQETGGATAIATGLLSVLQGAGPLITSSVLFLVVAIATNILSNNACAILFTPIAMSLAAQLGIDPLIFAITVVLGANCSFASPIGYQTNLMVMGPGHYRFRDFIRAGLPLILIMWVSWTVIAKYFYGL